MSDDDSFTEYRKQYPMLDIDAEFKKASKKLGEAPGRMYFEKWLSFAAVNFLKIPEHLKREDKERKIQGPWQL